MTTVKVKFKKSSVDDREGTIYYQVIHNRVTRHVITDYKVYAYEWNESHHGIIMSHDTERAERLMVMRDNIRCDMRRFNHIVMALTQRGVCFSAGDIVEEYIELTSRLSLSRFMEGIIARLRHDGKLRTGETYRSALNSFSNFRNNEDVMLDAISQDLMKSYEAYLQAKGLVPNSISFYLRILRAVYNRACEHGLITAIVNPFAHVYTGVEKTAKRAVDIEIIRRIKNVDLSMDKSADYARDMFMLSFYLRGISFIDLAYLRKSDLSNGIVTYRRRKTGQKLTIRWTKEMQAVLDKYPVNETEFLLPIITSRTANYRHQYRNRHYKVNSRLKTVADKVGLQLPLTTYVARHSWASIAKSKGIPVGIISEGLGHDNEQTTLIYLATLDTSAVDRANDIILSAL